VVWDANFTNPEILGVAFSRVKGGVKAKPIPDLKKEKIKGLT